MGECNKLDYRAMLILIYVSRLEVWPCDVLFLHCNVQSDALLSTRSNERGGGLCDSVCVMICVCVLGGCDLVDSTQHG